MTFEAFLDGLNKGGFAFLGMVLIALMLWGGKNAFGWIIKFIPVAWAELNQTIKDSTAQSTANLERALAQSDKVLERQAIMQDKLMAEMSGVADSHKTIVSRLDTVIDKLGDKK